LSSTKVTITNGLSRAFALICHFEAGSFADASKIKKLPPKCFWLCPWLWLASFFIFYYYIVKNV